MEEMISVLLANPAVLGTLAVLGTCVTLGTLIIQKTPSKTDDAKLKEYKEKYGSAISFLEKFSLIKRK